MISEKTLELNITHEILSLGNYFDYLLRCSAQPPWFAPPHDWFWQWQHFSFNRPAFATGLSLADEKRQGWDVRIDFDGSGSQPSRALFIQFKAGKHRGFSKDIASEFYGSRSSLAPFCQFGLNNNGSKNQHIVLRAIASAPHFMGAVVYAFPRIPNAGALKACVGRLIHVTSFACLTDIDALAATNGVVISVGHEHKYNTSYNHPLVEELCSEPTSLDSLPDVAAEIVGDILTAQIYRFMKDAQRWTLSSSERNLAMGIAGKVAFQMFDLELAKYFAVSGKDFEQALQTELNPYQHEALDNVVTAHNAFEEAYRRNLDGLYLSGTLRQQSARAEMFKAVAARLGLYRRLFGSGEWVGKEIPAPESKRAVTIPPYGLMVSLVELVDIVTEDKMSQGLKSISYQAF